jgi:DNA-binding NtrC family response regulator
MERVILTEELAKPKGNVRQAAETLQMDRSHLYTKLKQLGIFQGK